MICESIQFKQDALNQWRKKYKLKLKNDLDSLPDGPTRNQRDAKEKASEDYVIYCTEAFCGNGDLHPTPRDAALSI